MGKKQHVTKQDTVAWKNTLWDVVEDQIPNEHGNPCNFRAVLRGESSEPLLMSSFDSGICVIPPKESLPEELRQLEEKKDKEGRQIRVLKRPHNGEEPRYEFQHVGCSGKLFVRATTEETADLSYRTDDLSYRTDGGEDVPGYLHEHKPSLDSGATELVCPDCGEDFLEFLEEHLGELQRYE